jgi:hypothetical protein
VLGQPVVPVGAAQLVVAVGGHHRDDAPTAGAAGVGQVDDGDVERAAAQVVDEHGPVAGGQVGEPVGEGGGGGLVDDVDDVEPGVLAGELGVLALLVPEVGGHGDDDVGDGLAGVALGVGGERPQDQGGKRRR